MELVKDIGGRGEKILKDALSEEEKIFIKLKGSFGEALVLTSKRLYVLKWGFMASNFFGNRCNAFEFKNITSVEIRKNLMTGFVEILTPATQNTQKSYWGNNNTTYKADNIVSIQSTQFAEFTEAVRIIRDKISDSHKNENSSNNNALDNLSQLEKLSDLKEKGIITEEEFQLKKKQLLDL